VRIDDASLDLVREQGYAVVEGFLSGDELAGARACLWHHYPTPEQYAADPASHARFARSQFAGLRLFPFHGWDLNLLAFHPDLVDAVERYLGSTDLQLYKVELWAKYSGAIDYDQPPHRDFGNHSLVVPRADGVGTQLTTFVLLSDVTEADGPTRVVPLEHTRDIPMVPDDTEPGWPFSAPMGTFADVEVPVVGPAGSLFVYRTDVFHRGSDFTEPGRSRFALLADYQVRGPTWTGKMAWPNHAQGSDFVEVIERASVRERDLFGFPRPGDAYWNDQTLADVQRRYPRMDLTPYRTGAGTG
jgi:ectoine hydroxylase-related dioxygenase (phytanoyl-CoA dioxygenase family)